MSINKKNKSLFFTKHLHSKNYFKENNMTMVDLGARGGFDPIFDIYGDHVRKIGVEANTQETTELRKNASVNEVYIDHVLGKKSKDRDFFVTRLPESCGLFEKNADFFARFVDHHNLDPIHKMKVATKPLTEVLSQLEIRSIDYLKLDTEGAELEILESSTDLLQDSVLCILTEVQFHETRKEQPLFSNIDLYLRGFGFRLFDIEQINHRRCDFPFSLDPAQNFDKGGQLLWGNALYFYDPFVDSKSVTRDLLKPCSLLEQFDYIDFAIEILIKFKKELAVPDAEINKYVDLLVQSSCDNPNMTYMLYMDAIWFKEVCKHLVFMQQTYKVSTDDIADELERNNVEKALILIGNRIAEKAGPHHRLLEALLRRDFESYRTNIVQFSVDNPSWHLVSRQIEKEPEKV